MFSKTGWYVINKSTIPNFILLASVNVSHPPNLYTFKAYIFISTTVSCLTKLKNRLVPEKVVKITLSIKNKFVAPSVEPQKMIKVISNLSLLIIKCVLRFPCTVVCVIFFSIQIVKYLIRFLPYYYIISTCSKLAINYAIKFHVLLIMLRGLRS